MYKEIIKEIKNAAPKTSNQWVGKTYLGSPHKFLGVKTNDKRNIAKTFFRENKDLSKKKLFELLGQLYGGNTFEEKTIASELVFLYKNFGNQISLDDLDNWLGNLVGWAEIDSLCQSRVLLPFVEKDFTKTSDLIHQLSVAQNINKRRASLVLLVKPVSYLTDKKILNLAIEIIERLKHERSIIITKAISWLLRSMVANYKDEVRKYLEVNELTLPAIAVRETKKKLETGKKN